MLTIKVTKTTTRQNRFEINGRRRYCSWVLLGGVVETRIIRELVGSSTAQAPGDWLDKQYQYLDFEARLTEMNQDGERDGILR